MDAMTTDIFNALENYRCQYSQDDMGDGVTLVDMITPPGDADIGRGQKEMVSLAEHIAGDLFYRNR